MSITNRCNLYGVTQGTLVLFNHSSYVRKIINFSVELVYNLLSLPKVKNEEIMYEHNKKRKNNRKK